MEPDKKLTIREKKEYYLESLKGIQEPEQIDCFIKAMGNDTSKSIILNMDETLGIRVVARENNDFYLKSVEMMLAKLMLALNVKNNVTEQQIEMIPQLLVSEYPGFRLNDVWMVCKNIMLGKYKMFERLDTETFFRCVREYDCAEERSAAFEEFNKRSHETKSQAANNFIQLPEEIKNQFVKKKEAKIMLTPNDVPGMAFKVTSKESMKKLKGKDGRND